MAEPIRLNKHLAHSLGLSRREADDAIAAGRVAVDGQPAVLGARVSPASQQISLDGTVLARDAQPYTYLLLNKPVGIVSSRRQQGDTPTIYSLLPSEYQTLKPVGRLDKDSSGLLLLTNDGDFAHRMTHPSFSKPKSYEVGLDKPLEPLHQQMISDHGVMLDDGPSKLQLEKLSDDARQWRVLMHEGRNRQIRRTFASLGYAVTSLHRTHFGSFALGDLPSGDHRIATSPTPVA